MIFEGKYTTFSENKYVLARLIKNTILIHGGIRLLVGLVSVSLETFC